MACERSETQNHNIIYMLNEIFKQNQTIIENQEKMMSSDGFGELKVKISGNDMLDVFNRHKGRDRGV